MGLTWRLHGQLWMLKGGRVHELPEEALGAALMSWAHHELRHSDGHEAHVT